MHAGLAAGVRPPGADVGGNPTYTVHTLSVLIYISDFTFTVVRFYLQYSEFTFAFRADCTVYDLWEALCSGAEQSRAVWIKHKLLSVSSGYRRRGHLL